MCFLCSVRRVVGRAPRTGCAWRTMERGRWCLRCQKGMTWRGDWFPGHRVSRPRVVDCVVSWMKDQDGVSLFDGRHTRGFCGGGCHFRRVPVESGSCHPGKANPVAAHCLPRGSHPLLPRPRDARPRICKVKTSFQGPSETPGRLFFRKNRFCLKTGGKNSKKNGGCQGVGERKKIKKHKKAGTHKGEW